METKKIGTEQRDNVPVEEDSESKKDHKLAAEQLEREHLKIVSMDRDVPDQEEHFFEMLGIGPLTIRCNDEVKDAGATEIPEFDATRDELIQLAKYWAKASLEADYFTFVTNSASGTELRVAPRAYGRITRIADILGEEEVKKAVAETQKEYGKRQDARIWEIFLHGTREQRDKLQEEMNRKLHPNEYSEEPSEKRDTTAAEVTEHVLAQFRFLAKMLSSDPSLTKAEACDRLVFNILAGIDGIALKFPRLHLLTEDGLVINDNIALSDLWEHLKPR